MEYTITHNDLCYAAAINYDGTNYYNNPITILVNKTLFILPFGTSDRLHIQISGNEIYIVGENKGLDCISMVLINTEDNSIESCYLSSNDLNDKDTMCYGVFDLELEEQIKVLVKYLPY